MEKLVNDELEEMFVSLWRTNRHIDVHVVAFGFSPSLLYPTPYCQRYRLLRLERQSTAFMSSRATMKVRFLE